MALLFMVDKSLKVLRTVLRHLSQSLQHRPGLWWALLKVKLFFRRIHILHRRCHDLNPSLQDRGSANRYDTVPFKLSVNTQTFAWGSGWLLQWPPVAVWLDPRLGVCLDRPHFLHVEGLEPWTVITAYSGHRRSVLNETFIRTAITFYVSPPTVPEINMVYCSKQFGQYTKNKLIRFVLCWASTIKP